MRKESYFGLMKITISGLLVLVCKIYAGILDIPKLLCSCIFITHIYEVSERIE